MGRSDIMKANDKIKVFKQELEYIKDKTCRTVVCKALSKVDDKFFTAPASSTGKYHPQFAATDKGLVKHTKVAVLYGVLISGLEYYKLPDEVKDWTISALILHDTCKSGVKWTDKYTKHTHPILVEGLLNPEELTENEKLVWKEICDLIKTHMGQWNTNKHDSAVLPKPQTTLQMIVHMADYLASRKELGNVEDWLISQSVSEVKELEKPKFFWEGSYSMNWERNPISEGQIHAINKFLRNKTAKNSLKIKELAEIRRLLENNSLTSGQANKIIGHLKIAIEGKMTEEQLKLLKKFVESPVEIGSKLESLQEEVENCLKVSAGMTKERAEKLLYKIRMVELTTKSEESEHNEELKRRM
jgi:hypothetical protein